MSQSQKPKTIGRVIIPVLVALVAVAGLGFALVQAGDDDGSEPAANVEKDTGNQPEVDDPARRNEDDPMAIGDVDAPVVMVFYSDFQCPYCGQFARETEPELIEDYVEKGIMRIEWRDFPYIGEDSTKGAVAGRAAAEQDKFQEFHDAVYADQPEPNSGEMTDDYLDGIAEKIGLDMDEFHEDFDPDKFEDEVEEDFKEGQSLGVSAAPTFVINGIPIIGAQPTDTFTDVIDNEASEAE